MSTNLERLPCHCIFTRAIWIWRSAKQPKKNEFNREIIKRTWTTLRVESVVSSLWLPNWCSMNPPGKTEFLSKMIDIAAQLTKKRNLWKLGVLGYVNNIRWHGRSNVPSQLTAPDCHFCGPIDVRGFQLPTVLAFLSADKGNRVRWRCKKNVIQK